MTRIIFQLTRALALIVTALGAFSTGWATPPSLATNEPAPTFQRHALTNEDLDVWLDGLMPYALHQADVAGAVVVVVKDGQVLFKKGYGCADVARRRPVDPDTTLFRPGSISKLFTFTAVMQLVEAGRINLDADINQYLDFRIPPYHGQGITMRNLMTHTPGFEDSLRDLYADPSKAPPTLEVFVKQQIPERIYSPGTVTAYSNYGVTLAGYIVQRVSGEDFDDYMDRHILQPLGMHNSTFRQPLPPVLKPQMSNGYRLASSPARPFEIIGVAPAGSLAASGSDMAKFMIAHLQNGELDGQRILKATTAQEMHNTPTTLISPSIYRFLLGFYERSRNGHRIIAHDGDSQWFHSNLLLYLDDQVGLFVSMNSRGQGGGSSLIREALYQEFSDRYFPGPTSAQRVELPSAKQDAKLMDGDYLPSRRQETTFWSLCNLTSQVSVRDDGNGHLVIPQVTGLNRQPERFEEVAPFLWQEIGGKNRLAAKVSSGRIAMWSDDQDANGTIFLPAPSWKYGTWVLPALWASCAILLLVGFAWPIWVLVWRRLHVEGIAMPEWGEGVAPLGGLFAAVLMIIWYTMLNHMQEAKSWTSSMLPVVKGLHLLSVALFPIGAATAAWLCWIIWKAPADSRSALRISSAVLSLGAALLLLWASVTFHLLGLRAAF
jgi:CubicO group peptidase (beta-lactamase class C family)